MDSNKLKVLKSVNYRIVNTCSRCEYSSFSRVGNNFGTCEVTTYKHLKHSNSVRQLSIHRSGVCNKFKRLRYETLGGYEELIDGQA